MPRAAADALLPHLVRPAPRLPGSGPGTRVGGLASLLFHAAVAAAVTLVAASGGVSPPTDVPPPRARLQLPRMVFVPAAGIPRGGGGGGTRRPAAPPHHAVVVPSAPPPVAVSLDATIPAPLPSRSVRLAGLLGTPAPPADDEGEDGGTGTGGGLGTGVGTGIGEGIGPGVGPGRGGGYGGGVYRPGGDVSAPFVISKITPRYTPEALRIHLQGTVLLEAVVDPQGRATSIRVLRSLDAGLDREAIAALAQWRFGPGRRHGVPVDVLVTVLLDFRIH